MIYVGVEKAGDEKKGFVLEVAEVFLSAAGAVGDFLFQ